MRLSKMSMPMLALCMATMPSAGGAAVRTCLAEISGGAQMAGSVGEAQKQAIAAWMDIAKTMGGVGHTSWRLAGSKSLTCTPTEGSKVICTARARPCIIEQVAPKPWGPVAPGQPEPKVIPVPGPKAIKI